MVKLLGNTSMDFMRCANGNLPFKLFSLQRETRAEAMRSDGRRYLFLSYRLWHSTLSHGCWPMKRFTVISLACLLSACVSSLADFVVRPTRWRTFPQRRRSSRTACTGPCKRWTLPIPFASAPDPDKQEFSITTRPVSRVITRRKMG